MERWHSRKDLSLVPASGRGCHPPCPLEEGRKEVGRDLPVTPLSLRDEPAMCTHRSCFLFFAGSPRQVGTVEDVCARASREVACAGAPGCRRESPGKGPPDRPWLEGTWAASQVLV